MKKKRRIMQVVIFLFFVLVAMYELFPLVFLFIGSIKDELIQSVELALDLIEFLTASYPGILGKTYSVDESEDSVAILNAIAVNRC